MAYEPLNRNVIAVLARIAAKARADERYSAATRQSAPKHSWRFLGIPNLTNPEVASVGASDTVAHNQSAQHGAGFCRHAG